MKKALAKSKTVIGPEFMSQVVLPMELPHSRERHLYYALGNLPSSAMSHLDFLEVISVN